MDWDEPKATTAKTLVIGQDLSNHSVAELEGLVSALEAEISRVRAEMATKKARVAAADQIFKR